MKKKEVKVKKAKGRAPSKKAKAKPRNAKSDRASATTDTETTSGKYLRVGIPPGGKQVAIFGAGIAGLTAAHELIERGFQVEVFEREAADPVQRRIRGEECAIGGVARSQWAGIDSTATPSKADTQPVPSLPRIEIFFTFEGEAIEDEPVFDPVKQIAALRDAIKDLDATFLVQVRGHSRNRLRPGTPDDHAIFRAGDIFNRLVAAGVDPVRLRIIDAGLGRAGDWTAGEPDRDYVDFHVVQDVLPGEHGFRFFPAFYRNLFDTLRRIPIADDRVEFHETPNTVLDNIVPTEYQRLGLVEAPPKPERSFQFRRHPGSSLREGFDLLAKILSSLDCTFGDIARHQLRLFKYMTSCPERRAREYEFQSWYDFMDADNFSEKFRKIFDQAGQTNVAVRAAECDARTYGNVSVQLFLDQIRLAENVDGTLNGPTTLSWFDHWRRYLQDQGVIFRRGELLAWRFFQYTPPPPPPGQPPTPTPPPEVRAKVRIWKRQIDKYAEDFIDGETYEDRILGRDFYVVAVAVQDAVPLFDKDPQFTDPDFVLLRAFQLSLDADKDATNRLKGGPLVTPHAWLQRPLAGVQFFLPTDGAFVRGHTGYLESNLRLSSIAQPQFWFRRRGWWDGYRGVLSVDIGEWNEAWSMTRADIIAKVWKEVTDTIYDKTSIPDDYVAVHFDRFIVFRNDKPFENRAPYLVTRTGEFPKRPGKLDVDGYDVHLNKIVLAGTYMKTYTRLTTMESANESGRHAVNGILKASEFNGARCTISNPEAHEIDDLRVFVELDELLVKMGLPHFADILDLTEVPFALLCSGGNPHELLAKLGLDLNAAKGA